VFFLLLVTLSVAVAKPEPTPEDIWRAIDAGQTKEAMSIAVDVMEALATATSPPNPATRPSAVRWPADRRRGRALGPARD